MDLVDVLPKKWQVRWDTSSAWALSKPHAIIL